MGEMDEPFEPNGWDLRPVEIVPCEVKAPERSELEQRRVKSRAHQSALTEVKRGHTANADADAAADALPAAAIRAGSPRREGATRLVGDDGEGAFQPEQRRRLVRQARGHVSSVAVRAKGAHEMEDEQV